MAFLGSNKSEPSLIKETYASVVGGTKHEWMIKTAPQEGFYCYVNSHSSLNEIKHFLYQKLPVIVDYTEPSEDAGHYAVVIGSKRSKIILNDPWNGKDYSVFENDFTTRWHDRLTRSHGWIMVISKTNLELGKQYLPS